MCMIKYFTCHGMCLLIFFILTLIPAMSLKLIKLDGEIKRIACVSSLVISWLLPSICHPFREILSSGFIWADGVEITELYHLNNTFYSTSYLYRTRYNENAAFEHSDTHCSLVVTVIVNL